eukprot:CAMPEP_0180540338 /NCGR_PEP_ID=MMETSP1036_2-20121128/67362_1 /TAXON_ID=632150 /ORGANISM="Azadinium spinosum, Strain 3D9" /LENGTH=175 /DNA_ID=CAMNT_0022555125 /DNA_START=43 /DNA_END=570 /DNA_ORIENTATION=+
MTSSASSASCALANASSRLSCCLQATCAWRWASARIAALMPCSACRNEEVAARSSQPCTCCVCEACAKRALRSLTCSSRAMRALRSVSRARPKSAAPTAPRREASGLRLDGPLQIASVCARSLLPPCGRLARIGEGGVEGIDLTQEAPEAASPSWRPQGRVGKIQQQASEGLQRA